MQLDALSFVAPSVPAGVPLVLTGADSASVPVTVDVTAGSGPDAIPREGSGSPVVVQLDPWATVTMGSWSGMPAAELAELFTVSRGAGVIGFKEADAATGVDDHGNVLVSDSTVARAIQWVEDQGVTVTRNFAPMPAVSVDLPMPIDVQLVTTIRANANIDYLEPDEPVWFFQAPPGIGTVGAVIPTTGSAVGSLAVRPGDIVTATYVQPDGSTLSTQVVIQ